MQGVRSSRRNRRLLHNLYTATQQLIFYGAVTGVTGLAAGGAIGHWYTKKDVSECPVPNRTYLADAGPNAQLDKLRKPVVYKDCFEVTVPMLQIGPLPAHQLLSDAGRALFLSGPMRLETHLVRLLGYPRLRDKEVVMRRFKPGEDMSLFRVVAREFGDVQDNLIMEGSGGKTLTWLQVVADYTDEVYYFRFGSALAMEELDIFVRLLIPLHVVYSKVLLKCTVLGLGLQPGLPEFFSP